MNEKSSKLWEVKFQGNGLRFTFSVSFQQNEARLSMGNLALSVRVHP
jgi:hypothetical protein